MRIKSTIDAVRDKVNDADRRTWSDAQVVRWLDHHHAKMHRFLSNAHRSWGNHTYRIAKENTDLIREVNVETQRYYFPQLLYLIYGVRELSRGPNEPGTLMDYREFPREQGRGWYVSSKNSIDLLGVRLPIDIDIECCKLPPPLHYGTIDSGAPPGRDEIALDSQPLDLDSNQFVLDWQQDAYVGAEIEIITGSSQTTNRRGTVHQVVSQRHVHDNTLGTDGRWVIVCQVKPDFESVPQIGDTYEMHLNFTETNYEYVSALTARSLFHKTHNLKGIAVMKDVLDEGFDDFVSGLRPRQEQQPGFLVDPRNVSSGFYNADKDWSGEFLD